MCAVCRCGMYCDGSCWRVWSYLSLEENRDINCLLSAVSCRLAMHHSGRFYYLLHCCCILMDKLISCYVSYNVILVACKFLSVLASAWVSVSDKSNIDVAGRYTITLLLLVIDFSSRCLQQLSMTSSVVHGVSLSLILHLLLSCHYKSARTVNTFWLLQTHFFDISCNCVFIICYIL